MTPVISAVAVTVSPTGVAASWLMSSLVPTVVSPSLRNGATALQAASSMRAAIIGVANTGSEPLPTATARLVSSTCTEAVPLLPIVIGSIHILL